MIVDLFAGPGGWDEGCRYVGIDDVLGVEFDDAACETRYAAGHKTWQADIGAVSDEQIRVLADELGVRGLIGSPPCPAFSAAGKRGGMSDMDYLLDHVRLCADGRWRPVPERKWEDGTSRLTLEPLRWALTIRPTWVALEQVPPVLPIWKEVARVLDSNGWSTWTGVLNSADYGVPQTRRRAILMAHRDRPVAAPEATHDKEPQPTLFGPELEPWVTMAQALGWARSGSEVSEDAEVGFPRIDDRGDSEDGYRERDFRSIHEPAFGLTEKARSWMVREPTADLEAGEGRSLLPGGAGYEDPNRRLYGPDEPAPTVGFGHDAAGWGWVDDEAVPDNPVLNTGRDWKPGGTRADAQKIDPNDSPAPTVSSNTGDQWIVHDRAGDLATNICGCPDPGGQRICRRTPHNTGDHKTWSHLGERFEWPADRQGVIDGDTPDTPDGAEWAEGRPATTIAGDPRVAQPGHKAETTTPDAPGRMEGAIRITPAQALVLQSFPATYPVQGSRTKQFEQIGNAVPPLVAAHVIGTLDLPPGETTTRLSR